MLDLSRLFPAFLGMLCGAGIYLTLVNRVLSHLRDGILKTTFLPLALLACVGGLTVFGYQIGHSTWRLVLALILGWMFAAELRYRWLSWKLRSTPPSFKTGKVFSIFRPFTSQELQVLNYQITLPTWHGAIIRLAHLSDLHLNKHSPVEYFIDVMRQVNDANPDMIFITGDFVADQQGIEMLPQLLQILSCRLGKFAILGNHDYWTDPVVVGQAVRQAGLVLLEGNQVHVLDDGKDSLAICGCSAPWSKEACQPQRLPERLPLLALSHTADHIYSLNKLGAAAVFSGHYHAGQIQLPVFGPLIVPSVYGRLFYQGHYKVNGTHLFVSSGVGASHPPARIYCPPDILFVDLLAGRSPPTGG